MIPQVGDQLAGYRLDALVGRGGGGVVYRATHLRLDRPVALKLLTADLAADESFRRRFEREARLAAALEHPHIVPVYDAGEADGLLYLAMRFIEGHDLSTLIAAHGPLSLERTCAILGQVADALDVAHAAGLVHRDVKPANILVGAADAAGRDRVYLSDFGLTRRAEGTSLTGNMVAGTLTYMAPERFRAGTAPEPAADVYALACTACTCLSGSPPFTGGSFEEILAAHLYADPPRLSAADPRLPSAVDAVLARALAKDPAQRHPSCGAMVEGLRAASRLTEPTRDLSQRVPMAAGNLFFSDTGNRRLRRIDPNGVITTAAGTGTSGQGADGPALTVPLDSPGGLAVVPASGDVYVVEGTYDRVYLLDPAAGTMSRTAGVPY